MAQSLDVVDGRETAKLVVALHHAQRQVLGRDVDADDLVVVVANKVRRTAQGTVLAGHVGYLFLQLVGEPAVVAVAEGYVTALGAFDGAVTGYTGTDIVLQILYLDASVSAYLQSPTGPHYCRRSQR